MSSRREVFIRILALLQRKTLIETKNHTLKCLKQDYLTVRSMKNVAVLTADRAFALFFCPHPGGCDSSRVPTPGNWLMHNSFLNNGSVDFRGIDSILKDGPISFCTVKDFSAGCLCFCWWISVYSLLFPANEPFCWLRCSCSFDFSFSYPARKTRQD